jgi:hypothetical protein
MKLLSLEKRFSNFNKHQKPLSSSLKQLASALGRLKQEDWEF